MADFSDRKFTVLVTGGTGLVGKAIESVILKDSAHAEEHWIFLSSKEGDLRYTTRRGSNNFPVNTFPKYRDREATRAIFVKYKPTHVIHLAAMVGGLFRNLKYKVNWDTSTYYFK